jgi:hypothetical protein
MTITTLYHTATLAKNGDWGVVNNSKPVADECSDELPEGTGTDHPAMGAVQQPLGWVLVGILEDTGEWPSVTGVFAIDFDT